MPRTSADYRLTPEALRDLESIWLDTLGEWGIEQAHRYIDDLTAAFEQLANTPRIGAACDHIRKGYRRAGVGRHGIYYRVAEHGITVIRILHDRMDVPRHL